LRPTNTVWKNEECSIIDLGDGIINIEFHSKMNTLGEGVLKGLNHGIDLAEAKYRGVVVSNLGDNFSVGANLFMVTMMIGQGAWDQLEMATKYFQDTVMRLRYSDIPVVLAPHQFTFGGACEMSMHADVTIPHAETYMGLVEVGVGVLPGGAGTKEFALRMSDRYRKGDVDTNILLEALMTIGTAKVATSAQEAFNLGYLLKHKDKVAVNRERQLADAKRIALLMAEQGYTRPVARKDIRVLGRVGLGMVEAGVYNMQFAGYASEHDRLITSKIGYVLCGGDVSEAAEVSEQYLLDIEREAFLFLCGTEKTQARITHMLSTGKPLRN
jgi:3-hydroxyacyl-CoA dehydrogenase